MLSLAKKNKHSESAHWLSTIRRDNHNFISSKTK
jgi:hypothetical protein